MFLVAEEYVMKILYMSTISENSFSRQTGSRCQMDIKMYPMIQHSNMKLDAKYQQAMIYNSGEKCYENFCIGALYQKIHFLGKQEVDIGWISKHIPQ